MKHSTPKHKQIEPQQKHHLGAISNINLLWGWGGGGLKSVLHGPNRTLILCSGSQHLVSWSVLVVNL